VSVSYFSKRVFLVRVLVTKLQDDLGSNASATKKYHLNPPMTDSIIGCSIEVFARNGLQLSTDFVTMSNIRSINTTFTNQHY
jgi:hypothetical protein